MLAGGHVLHTGSKQVTSNFHQMSSSSIRVMDDPPISQMEFSTDAREIERDLFISVMMRTENLESSLPSCASLQPTCGRVLHDKRFVHSYTAALLRRNTVDGRHTDWGFATVPGCGVAPFGVCCPAIWIKESCSWILDCGLFISGSGAWHIVPSSRLTSSL